MGFYMPNEIKFVLTWYAAPRPPVHPEKMKGVMSFDSAYDAGVFFSRQPSDSEFISLIMRDIFETDVSELILKELS